MPRSVAREMVRSSSPEPEREVGSIALIFGASVRGRTPARRRARAHDAVGIGRGSGRQDAEPDELRTELVADVQGAAFTGLVTEALPGPAWAPYHPSPSSEPAPAVPASSPASRVNWDCWPVRRGTFRDLSSRDFSRSGGITGWIDVHRNRPLENWSVMKSLGV
jgi:hypothetical protein